MLKNSSSNFRKPSPQSSNSDLTIDFVLPLLRIEAKRARGSCLPCRTALEWAKVWSIGHNRARHIVRKLLELGYLRRSSKSIENISGIVVAVNCFEPTSKTSELRPRKAKQAFRQ